MREINKKMKFMVDKELSVIKSKISQRKEVNRMKLIKFFVILLWLLIFAVSVKAGDLYSDEPYDKYGNPQYRYEGLSGTRYQYDLSDPCDRLEYQLDLDAQMRDRINPNPGIQLDRELDQYGGGAEW